MSSAVFLGLANVDILYASEIPRENQKVVAKKQQVLCGGPAANAAITCAFLGQQTKLVAAVGKHLLANVIRADMDEHQISLIDLASSSEEMPSVSAILVSGNGNRAIISGHATRTQVACNGMDVSFLNDAAVLMVDGHQMDCAIRAAADARSRGIPVVLDGGSWKQSTELLLSHTTFAICSEDFRTPGSATSEDVIDYVLRNGTEAIAITRGNESILWATKDRCGEITVPAVKAVDTMGAGDVFHGAFCYYLAKGLPFTDALQSAAEIAAFSCQFFGTRDWMQAWRR